MITNALLQGNPVAMVASSVGNSPKTTFEYYTAHVGGSIFVDLPLPQGEETQGTDQETPLPES